MGKNSRARREARRRSHPRTGRAPSSGAGPDDVTPDDVVACLETALRYAVSAPRAVGPRIEQLEALGSVAGLDPAALVVDQVVSRIGSAWENGWQPGDLVHAARRRTSAPTARWLARAILVEADRTGARERAPQAWSDQLDELASRRPRLAGTETLLAGDGSAGVGDWTVALVALDLMRRLPRAQVLVPPPSQWGRVRRPVSARAHRPDEHQAKTLTRVRALLAKAESTEFAAEAEAFTAKAQDLMTRHSIDEALLADEAGWSIDVQAVRVLIHHPYALEKASLLDVVARANRTRAVWNDFASSATLVGVPTDVAQVEMLFTSTLVQATRAMTQAGEGVTAHRGDRSSGFRKAFLVAYAHRIGERLTQSSEEAVATYTTDLVPVLARQTEAIEDEFERLFPHVTTGSRRRSLDARGWEAGTRAADAAVIPAGMVEG